MPSLIQPSQMGSLRRRPRKLRAYLPDFRFTPKQGEPPTLFLRGFPAFPGPTTAPARASAFPVPVGGTLPRVWPPWTSPQRQDSCPHLPFGEVRTPWPSPARPAAVKETCAWFTDNYEQARK